MRQQSKHAPQNSVFSPDAHVGTYVVRAGSYSVFLDRAAEEQRSTFYADCCCCRATHELPNHLVRAPSRSTAVKKCLTTEYKKRRIQAPGTTFSTFSDEVRLEGGHGSFCQVPKKTISALPNYGSKRKFGARAESRYILQEELRGRGGSSCTI